MKKDVQSKLPKVILFDADGTLYESAHLHFEAHRRTAQELHDYDYPKELYEEHVWRGQKSSPEVLADQGVNNVDSDEYSKRKKVHFKQLVDDHLEPHEGLVEFLDWCHEHSIRRVVVSAGRRADIEAALNTTGIAEYFEAVVSREDVDGNDKPHPLPYEIGLRIMGVTTKDAIAIEDSHKGLSSAKAAGLRCVAITNQSNNLPNELDKADYVIDHYDELIPYLLQ